MKKAERTKTKMTKKKTKSEDKENAIRRKRTKEIKNIVRSGGKTNKKTQEKEKLR